MFFFSSFGLHVSNFEHFTYFGTCCRTAGIPIFLQFTTQFSAVLHTYTHAQPQLFNRMWNFHWHLLTVSTGADLRTFCCHLCFLPNMILACIACAIYLFSDIFAVNYGKTIKYHWECVMNKGELCVAAV